MDTCKMNLHRHLPRLDEIYKLLFLLKLFCPDEVDAINALESIIYYIKIQSIVCVREDYTPILGNWKRKKACLNKE